MELDNKVVTKFLKESNHIEREYSREALNDAKKAWDYLIKAVPPRGKKEITLDHILEVQRLLLHRISPEKVGWRTCSVRIGWQVKKYNGRTLLLESLENAIFLMNHNVQVPREMRDSRTKKAHVEFEDVHPFPDGNGRTGRILYNWHRLRLKLPIHIIHEGDEQYAYYQWFDKALPESKFLWPPTSPSA